MRSLALVLSFTSLLTHAAELSFKNKYGNYKRPGLYVDVMTGEPLFSSLDRFDSGTVWPSFTKGLDDSRLTYNPDYGDLGPRTEVRSKKSKVHLGHVFDDGPEETGGKRYCIDSSSLRFVPLEDLKKEGYGEYLRLFKRPK